MSLVRTVPLVRKRRPLRPPTPSGLRVATVVATQTTQIPWTRGRPVRKYRYPALRIGGPWLAAIGLPIGATVTLISPEPGVLLVRAIDAATAERLRHRGQGER